MASSESDQVYMCFPCHQALQWNKSLDPLLSALTSSILPGLNSLILFFIFTSIIAVLATHLYGEDHRKFLETC